MMHEILKLARWAPSGDNEQNWRFEILSESKLLIHGDNAKDFCWMDATGKASLISLGALTENISLAASQFGYLAHITPQKNPLKILVELEKGAEKDPLAEHIQLRQTNRFPYSRKKIPQNVKDALIQSLGDRLETQFFDKTYKVARLNMLAAKVRLHMPDIYKDLVRIIDWEHEKGKESLPAKSLGMDPISLAFFKWILKSEKRYYSFMNLPGFDIPPRLTIDFIPSMFCGVHFFLHNPNCSHFEAGRGLQRFWLTATKHHLCLQPSYTHIALIDYSTEKLKPLIQQVMNMQKDLLQGRDPHTLLFSGRLGYGNNPVSRSIRRDINELVL